MVAGTVALSKRRRIRLPEVSGLVALGILLMRVANKPLVGIISSGDEARSLLLDSQTGEYNISYIRQYIHEILVNLIELARREQGLIVRHGNPK